MSISRIFSLTHTGLAKRIHYHPTLLDAVEKCRTRWSNECNRLDPEFWTQGPGTKIFRHVGVFKFLLKLSIESLSLIARARLFQNLGTTANARSPKVLQHTGGSDEP